MTSTTGKCLVDGVAVLEAKIDLLNQSPSPLHGTYALVSAKEGARFGRGERNTNWSGKTNELVMQLLASMETDILSSVFEGGTPSAGASDDGPPSDGVPGI